MTDLAALKARNVQRWHDMHLPASRRAAGRSLVTLMTSRRGAMQGPVARSTR